MKRSGEYSGSLMNVKWWAAGLIALIIVSLTPLAYASPPDPSWIRGLYDGGDFDDVVVMLTGGSGIIDPFPLIDVRPVLAVTGTVLQADAGFAPTRTLSTNLARGPPSD
ncbi:MAG TPA: hypothetical protein VMS64_30275 [Candidatus Methylomirabilis sp.]|nr:hypothetical protein [Candidatus Methylomirabilis sp.]